MRFFMGRKFTKDKKRTIYTYTTTCVLISALGIGINDEVLDRSTDMFRRSRLFPSIFDCLPVGNISAFDSTEC